jgi:hypothetical protein
MTSRQGVMSKAIYAPDQFKDFWRGLIWGDAGGATPGFPA